MHLCFDKAWPDLKKDKSTTGATFQCSQEQHNIIMSEVQSDRMQ